MFPFIGKMPIANIGPRDVLDRVLRKLEARGAVDTAHRVKQLCGQIFRFAVASELADRDVTSDLKEALATKSAKNHAAITEPKKIAELLRSIRTYAGHPGTVAALKLAPLVFVRPGELRTAEWDEIDLDAGEWRIPGVKMKVDHIVPLFTQAVGILRGQHPVSGRGRYVFPSIRTGERPMSENTINAALRGMGYSADVHTAHGFRAKVSAKEMRSKRSMKRCVRCKRLRCLFEQASALTTAMIGFARTDPTPGHWRSIAAAHEDLLDQFRSVPVLSVPDADLYRLACLVRQMLITYEGQSSALSRNIKGISYDEVVLPFTLG